MALRKLNKRIKLLSRLESKNGKKWIDLYEDSTYQKVSYYYTTYNGGGNLGEVTLLEAATKVVDIAKTMGKLIRIEISTVKE